MAKMYDMVIIGGGPGGYSAALYAARAGLSAAVLTQLSDVEDEINGLLTYDRQVVKVDPAEMQKVAAALLSAFEAYCRNHT